jgi:hypothetical protein
MAKKKNSRKALAVALGIMGVAGLSLASAAQLTVNTSNEVAMGVGVFAACDDAVDVSYTYDSVSYEIDEITISDISVDCAGEDLFFSLEDAAAVELATDSGAIAGTSYVYDASGDAISIGTDLGDVVVVIG